MKPERNFFGYREEENGSFVTLFWGNMLQLSFLPHVLHIPDLEMSSGLNCNTGNIGQFFRTDLVLFIERLSFVFYQVVIVLLVLWIKLSA